MFVALKNWRERLKHQGDDYHRLLAGAEGMPKDDARDSAALLRHFRAALVPCDDLSSLCQLGPEFADAEPLSAAQNLSIMASVQRGAVRQKRRG
jgi:hypothetical protein